MCAALVMGPLGGAVWPREGLLFRALLLFPWVG